MSASPNHQPTRPWQEIARELARETNRQRVAELGSELKVNVAAYSPEEFREKIKSGDHFLAAVLRGQKQFVKGGQSDLDEIVGK